MGEATSASKLHLMQFIIIFQGGYVLGLMDWFVCLSVGRITQSVMDEFLERKTFKFGTRNE